MHSLTRPMKTTPDESYSIMFLPYPFGTLSKDDSYPANQDADPPTLLRTLSSLLKSGEFRRAEKEAAKEAACVYGKKDGFEASCQSKSRWLDISLQLLR